MGSTRFIAGAFGALAAALLVAPAGAQQPSSMGDSLKLPDLQVLGTIDPNVRKATAIVNGDIITDTDVDQRLSLVLIANSGRISDQEREVLRLQVLRNLIDEKLQIQEAGSNEVRIGDAEVEAAYARVAANFRQNSQDFETFRSNFI